MIYISRLATVVKDDSKVLFSLVTTPKFWNGRCSFPWIAPLYPKYISYNAEC